LAQWLDVPNHILKEAPMPAKKPTTPAQEEAQARQRSARPDQPDFQAHDRPAPAVAIQPERLQAGDVSAAEIPQLQRAIGNRAVADVLQRSGAVIQRKESYAFGSANTVPHIHVYSGGDCHLKIVDRGSIKRYNIIKDGKRHSQADMALEAAAGNQPLIDAINTLLA
jgi:hypothetical protein